MPKLVVCRCDPKWHALAVCETCELRDLEVLLTKQGKVAREHPSTATWDALVASYYRDVDTRDGVDRARDLADDYRLGAS